MDFIEGQSSRSKCGTRELWALVYDLWERAIETARTARRDALDDEQQWWKDSSLNKLLVKLKDNQSLRIANMFLFYYKSWKI